MTVLRSIVVLGCGCMVSCVDGPPPGVATQISGIVTSTGCIDPVSLGAIPNDGIDDHVAVQAAIDAVTAQPDGGTVCLGPGRWTVNRAKPGNYNRFASLSTHSPHPLVIRGVGPETVLELTGDQGASTSIVISVDPGAQHVRITDLTIDTTASTNTDEQTHAIATTGVCSGATCQPIRDLQIDNVHFIHPRNTPSRKGDCVHLLGNDAATQVYDVRITGNDFRDAARSAIGLQRGLHGVVIANNTIHCESCDQQIDGEASGGWDYGIVISGNSITSGRTVQGDHAIALTSVEGATVVGNKLDRGIAAYRTRDVVIANNSIATVATKADQGGTIWLRNVCEGNVVSGNTIRRTGAAGPVISLEPHSAGVCSGAAVTGNVMTQGTPRWALYAEAFGRGSITGNTINYTVAAPAFSAIYNRSTLASAPVTALSIAQNAINGAVTYGVTLEGAPGSFGAGVVLNGNVAVGTAYGLRCKNTAYFTAPITSSGNSLGPSTYSGGIVSAGD